MNSVQTFFKALVSWRLLCLVMFTGVVVQAEDPWDPWENVNRSVFDFNDVVDRKVFEPIAQSYEDTFPRPVKTGVKNFFRNLEYPSYLVSDLLQLKFSQIPTHTGRFLINSTIGVVGLIDVAHMWGLENHEEDFATALQYNGVPAGPYIVIPFLGPSNLRDATGRAVDAFLNPIQLLFFYGDYPWETELGVSVGTRAVQVVSIRAGLLEAVRTARESSYDYYLFVQGAYYQNRAGLTWDGNPPEEMGDKIEDQ